MARWAGGVTAPGPCPRRRACRTRPGIGALRPLAATRRNSERRVRRPGTGGMGGASSWPGAGGGCAGAPRLGGQALAALRAAIGEDLAAADGRHAGAEAVPALTDQLRRLVGALHEAVLRAG